MIDAALKAHDRGFRSACVRLILEEIMKNEALFRTGSV